MAAQSGAPCAGRACTAADFSAGVTELHQLKNDFVAALRRFAESVTGSYGDEGPEIRSSLDDMRRALDSWDRAIAVYEITLRAASATADLHAALGTVYLDRSRVPDALREFAAASRLAPRRADLHELTAAAYDLAGDRRNAAVALEKAAAVAPDDPGIWYRLSLSLESTGAPAGAQRARQRLETIQPHAPAGHSGEPVVQFERVNLLRQVAGVAPIFPPRLYVAGFRLLLAGRYPEALISLREATTRDPVSVSASAAVVEAATTLRRGQLQAALSRLRTALAQAPDDGETQRIAGVAYWGDDQWDKSIDAFSAAVRLNPQDERARLALADVFVTAGRSADAERTLTNAIQAMPESGLAHYRLGQLYYAQSLLPAALDEFERAAACNPIVGLDHLFETIGGLYVNQARFDGAVAAYLKRIDLNPNHADAHRKLGEIYLLQGRDDEALAEFAVTGWLDPGSADARAASGQIYLRRERYADAALAAREALTLDPEHQKARYTLGTALMRLGETAEGQHELDIFEREVAASAASQQRRTALNGIRRDAARLLAAGDAAGAAIVLRQAISYAPAEARSYLDLGGALMTAGQPLDALDSFLKARDLTDSPEVHRLLAGVYRALGRTEDREREDTLSRRLAEQVKEERLRRSPLLR
jgi:tetratricopeptide (TPR) repeat protein